MFNYYMINFLHWLLYYIKCIFNIILSYFNNFTKTKKSNYIDITNIDININNNFNKINDNLYIVKLYGSYYDMGKMYGKYMKKILNTDVNTYYNYIIENQYIFNKKIPLEIRKDNIIDSIMNLYNCNKEYYNNDIIDFIIGVSNETKIKFKKLIVVNVFNDIMDNHCIILNKRINNKILNLRTLDYGVPNLLQALIIFHPKNKYSYCSLNISCHFGIFSGLSEKNIFFGETYHDNNLGNINYIGTPFHHMAHNVLNSCLNINEGIDIMKNIVRTSNLELLLSDKNNSKILLFSNSKLVEKNKFYNVTPMEMNNFLKNKKYLDNIDNVLGRFIPNTKSGELHCFISYDNNLYISVTTKYLQSYNNIFYRLKISELFI